MSIAYAAPTIISNLHTHTYRCKHAAGNVNDYCRAAIDRGMTILGFSDHTALPDNRWPGIRMDFSELRAYNRDVDIGRQRFPELTILKGMECEYAAEYVAYYRDTLLGELGFDYLVGAAHCFPYRDEWVNVYGGTRDVPTLRAYADYLIALMASGLFAFVAHPDLFGNAYLCWDANATACARDILQAAEALRIPLEVNGYGLRKPKIDTPEGSRSKYPWLPFWELAAEYEISVVVNSDAHRPEDVMASIAEGLSIVEACHLALADMAWLQPSYRVQPGWCVQAMQR
ncbi:MAG: histidinol-phosphatase [Anaerolineae bacterium]|nr:histidinol-phosphatase [Anaerolineae bacterium]